MNEHIAELKSCPFCGSTPSWRKDRFHVMLGCQSSDCYAQPEVMAEAEEDAIAIWNRRAPLEPKK